MRGDDEERDADGVQKLLQRLTLKRKVLEYVGA